VTKGVSKGLAAVCATSRVKIDPEICCHTDFEGHKILFPMTPCDIRFSLMPPSGIKFWSRSFLGTPQVAAYKLYLHLLVTLSCRRSVYCCYFISCHCSSTIVGMTPSLLPILWFLSTISPLLILSLFLILTFFLFAGIAILLFRYE
jgi:hypothetical protein